jgi:hypothetical protein
MEAKKAAAQPVSLDHILWPDVHEGVRNACWPLWALGVEKKKRRGN